MALAGGGGHIVPDGLVFFKGANFGVTSNQMFTQGTANNRACVFVREQVNGAGRYVAYNVKNWVDPAYGIPIPTGCTKVTVDCPSLQCAINTHKDINGTVYAVNNGYWSSTGGETNYDLASYIANGATHISIGFRNSSNTTIMNYTIDSTTVRIYFDI